MDLCQSIRVSTVRLADRQALVDPTHRELSIVAQCALLKIPRSTYYYRSVEASPEELDLLRVMDEIYLSTPFYGSRRMTVVLRQRGYDINRKRVQRLMRQLGLQVIYPKPKLSQRYPDHKIYPGSAIM
jgi:putative transposase